MPNPDSSRHLRYLSLLVTLSAAPALGQWSATADPHPTATALGPGFALVVGEKIAVGGWEFMGLGGMPVDLFDVGSGSWSTEPIAVPPQARATAVGARMLIAGGGSSFHTAPWDTALVQIYDDITGAWSNASLSVARYGVAATTVGTKAYFAGGASYVGSLGVFMTSDVVDVYDDSNGTWSTMTLPTTSHVGIGISIGQQAWFVDYGGGIHIYDEPTGNWTTTALPTITNPRQAVAAGSRIAFKGGGPTLDIYDDATGTWSSTTLPTDRQYSTLAAVGSRIFVVGGNVPTPPWGIWSDLVEIYDPLSGTWSNDHMRVPRANCAVTSIGERTYICGGWGSRGYVEIYDDSIGDPYCASATQNSTGLHARLTAQGYPGQADQSHVLLASSDLPPHSTGLFLVSTAQAHVPMAGGGQGVLCLGGAVGRLSAAPFLADVTGRATLEADLAAMPTPGGYVAVLVGDTWNFQAWYRDSNPAPTSNFTDAMSVTFQ